LYFSSAYWDFHNARSITLGVAAQRKFGIECRVQRTAAFIVIVTWASLGSRGHSLDSSDVGELTEACMMTKGYELKEDGPRCTDDMRTATNPKCYYRNTLVGGLSSWLISLRGVWATTALSYSVV
jgi:hypothetical protein